MPRTTSLIERDGVNAVEGIVLRELGWCFREQSVEDEGIDAHVEIRDDGKLTGRLIAVQIKSGISWFEEESVAGWTYRGSPRHLEYWRSHSLPVILTLFHPVERRAWWVAVSDEAVRTTRKGWEILVPKSQELNAGAAALLRPLALPDYRKRHPVHHQVKRFRSRGNLGPDRLGTLFHALSSAESRIDILSPVLSTHLLWALKPLAHRGVAIRILTGSMQENPSLVEEVKGMSAELAPLELRVWLPSGDAGNLHAKYILIDRLVAVYGSANFTVKSWRTNYEQVLASGDPDVVTQLAEEFEKAWRSGQALPAQQVIRFLSDSAL